MDVADVKRRVRKLKSLEIEIRYGKSPYSGQPLLWDAFFDLTGKRKVKYSLACLLSMDNPAYRKIANEFLAFVYSDFFGHLDFESGCPFDRALLVRLDLPFDADIPAIKKRFRQLAKQYHPDTGGEARKFIELMDTYKKLIHR